MGDQGSLVRDLGQAVSEADAAPVGAVLVVGGGIAGMQASLDLADQGYRVHLVEAKSAIGGHMAQLDKTFPTNDCAMCTISPKLVETGRHLNIDLHVDTEVVGVDGQAGDFTVTLRKKPRYIDVTKCVGCGDCAGVCPVVLPDASTRGCRSAARRTSSTPRPFPMPTPSRSSASPRVAMPAPPGSGHRATSP